MTPSTMKVTELRDALAARGLNSKGLKKELVDRLEEAMKTDDNVKTEDLALPSKPDEVEEKIDDNHTVEDIKEPESEKAMEEELPITDAVEEDKPAVETVESDSEPLLPSPIAEIKNESLDSIVSPISEVFVVHVTGFLRPFTIQAAKDLFNDFGPVAEFWMDSIKSYAYAAFQDSDAAAKCVAGLEGKQWPAEFGKNLSANISSKEEMEKAVSGDSAPSASRKRSIGEVADERSAEKRIKSLDELFLKTQTTPHLYYKPAH